ncbi:MAG TPA: helix-hairpin-helix domain-containing protein [Acidobacteriaceae bacterium]|nr:helix-hairpin-helix domain-containing protein [Acidobacteriaceae bacterium]
MQDQRNMRAASLPEAILIVCLVVLFSGAAFQELSGRAIAAQAQSGATQPAKQTVAEKIAASQQLLDINTATADQLKILPGMGAAYAQRVIDGRPYTAKNQLATRGILPKDEYERIRELIVAHRPKK